jgi:hypothetical protein
MTNAGCQRSSVLSVPSVVNPFYSPLATTNFSHVLQDYRNMTSRYWLLTAAGFGLLVAGTQALAAPATEEPAANENIVEIGPDQSAPADAPAPRPPRAGRPFGQPGFGQAPPTPASPYWIGLLAGEVSPELRAHLTLPEGKGLLVREVVPNSPAERAGIKNFDVIVAADDVELADMRELVQLVSKSGDDGADIALQIVRQGQQEVITITPEKRPENVAGRGGPGAEFGPPAGPEGFGPPEGFDPQDPAGVEAEMMRRFPGFGRMRGMPGGGGGRAVMQMQALPNGVSVSIQKQNDQPAQITVQRGEEKWVIEGDDPASLEQLPEELRPPVAQMLAGLNGPQMPQFNPWNLPPEMAPNDDAINQRMQQMEQQLQELKRKMLDEQGEEE